MGLLDYADTARKKLAGLLGEMPLVQMAQGRAEMPTMAGVLGALKSMPVFSPDAGQSAYEAALNIGPIGLGKIVYHGSPHKFHKFDASKIGTGEGAQAYGHGLYLADAPEVAGGYARGLGGLEIGGKAVDYNDPMHVAAATVFDLGSPSKAADWLYREAKRTKSDVQMKASTLLDGLIDSRNVEKGLPKVSKGVLYKADLPDEWIPKMLDWDNSIPEAMRQQISKPMMEKFGSGASGGQGLNQWKAVVWEFKNSGSKQPEIDAANFLRENGIPGIRYLDGGSRGKGQGSYNYVVFPGLEDQVKILERNGIPLSGLLGGQ